jgi:hypothetical protein
MSRRVRLTLFAIVLLAAVVTLSGQGNVTVNRITGVETSGGMMKTLSETANGIAADILNRAMMVGGVANDAPASEVNPVLIGCWASLPIPAAVSAALDAARIWCDPNGTQFIRSRPTMAWKDVAYTTTQTGAAVWTPASGYRPVITSVEIDCGGTTPGTLTLWFGASGDTTFSQGTDQPLSYFDCNTPSATNTPNRGSSYPAPVQAQTIDYLLRATTSANLTVRVIVHGFELP